MEIVRNLGHFLKITYKGCHINRASALASPWRSAPMYPIAVCFPCTDHWAWTSGFRSELTPAGVRGFSYRWLLQLISSCGQYLQNLKRYSKKCNFFNSQTYLYEMFYLIYVEGWCLWFSRSNTNIKYNIKQTRKSIWSFLCF